MPETIHNQPGDKLVVQFVDECPHLNPDVLQPEAHTLEPGEVLMSICRAGGGQCIAPLETIVDRDGSHHSWAIGHACMRGRSSRLSEY